MMNKDYAVVQTDILNAYYADNARKLHRVVDKILFKFGGLTYKDMDDFYSLANEVFADVLKRYDYEQSFDGFLYSCLSNKIMSEITKRNREKRKADRLSISLDATIGDSDATIADTVADDFDIFQEIFRQHEYQGKAEQYISKLSNQQINILNLLIDGYKPFEVRRILELSSREYADDLSIMRSYENVKVLF